MSKSKKRNKKQNRQAHNNNADIVISKPKEAIKFIVGNEELHIKIDLVKNSEKKPPKESDYYFVLKSNGYFDVMSWTKAGWNTYINVFENYNCDCKFNDELIAYWGVLPSRYDTFKILDKELDE